MYFISQVGQHDCAFACLKMLLANYHHDKNYLFLTCEDRPYSFKDLTEIASTHHMKTKGVRINDVKELEQSKNYPFIVTLEKRKGCRHSVILLGVTRKYAKVYDPENGKRKIPLETFYEQWDMKALIVEKEVGHKKVKCDIQITDFIDKKDKVTLPIWQLISSVSLLVGVYFINSNSYFFVPVIFLALFLIFEILFRRNLISALKRMDDHIFNYKIKAEEKQYFDFYRVMEKYRYVALSIIPNFIYTILVSVFVTFILVLNGLLNIVYVGIALVIAVLHVYVYLPYEQRKHNEIMEEEAGINDVKNQFQFRSIVERAHEHAYQVGLFKNALSYIEIAVILMSAITIMSVSQVVSIIYIVFYLCITIYLKDNFVRLLQYSTQSENYDSYLAKLLHYMDLSISNNSID